jgi:hypothetical protein
MRKRREEMSPARMKPVCDYGTKGPASPGVRLVSHNAIMLVPEKTAKLQPVGFSLLTSWRVRAGSVITPNNRSRISISNPTFLSLFHK